jgi:hypothetical protein
MLGDAGYAGAPRMFVTRYRPLRTSANKFDPTF